MRFFDTDSKPLVGGKVYAFKVGTDEFKPTYRNSELTALNTNPVVLDGAGSALIYLRGANLLKIYDRHGNFIEERIEYQQRERAQFYDDYGRPLKNGYVYTYDYQSTIRKTSYSIDNVINPNPIVLDENGTALVNIVGAYRLRQYNSKNVFVGDQDFKRPPVKALTSRVYSAFFIDDLHTRATSATSYTLKERVDSQSKNNIATSAQLCDAYTRDNAPLTHFTDVNFTCWLEDSIISTAPLIESKSTITIQSILIDSTLRPEIKIKTVCELALSAQLGNSILES